jgi:futalosine hydrolase
MSILEICIVTVLIVSATRKEIEPYLKLHPDARVIITGVGSYATLFQLCKHLQNNNYNWVIQCGIAGGGLPEDIGNAFLINRDRFADVGVWEKGSWNTIQDLGFCLDDEPFADGWMPNKHLPQLRNDFRCKDAITVNLITDKVEWNEIMFKKFSAEIESMEGAALHYVCSMMNIPFVQIRGVSNMIGEREKSKWKIEEAINASNQMLSEIIEKIKGN